MNRSDPTVELERIAGLLESGQPERAEAEAAALGQRNPHASEPLRLRALALLQLGRAEAARACLAEALAIEPEAVPLHANLGSVLLALGQPDEAAASFERALAHAPAHPALLNGLGNAHRARGDLAAAADAYARATHAAPGHAGAWMNLAAVQLARGATADAEAAVRHALRLAPGHPEGLLLLGHVLAARSDFAGAEAAYAAGERSAPRDPRFPYQRGLMAEEQRQLGAAANAHARALELAPGMASALGQLLFLRRQLCEWDGIEALSARARELVAAGAAGIAPFAFLSEPANAAEQLRCARSFAEGVEAAAAPLRRQLAFTCPPRGVEEPLRVGFASNGFGRHPTGLLTVAFFEALAATPVRAELFATAPDDGSEIAARLRRATAAWHDLVGLPPVTQARHIHAAGLDVLVDLRGYGGGGIAETLALRPAPIQVGWLAYPGTSGAPWLDAYIADAVVLPERLRAAFSETVHWLPRCFQPCDTTRTLGTPPPRTELGLPESSAVFACFNNSYKLNPATLERLLAVLRGVPGSVLWLLSGPEGADARLRAEASRRGIDPARLVFAAKRAHAEYLALYRHADLFLDTAPYGAHTTASDALFAGCPVLTTAGETFASRVATSLVHHLGLPELAAADDAAFVAHATALGKDPAAREALRARLAAQRASSRLFDMRGFADDFAALMRTLVERGRARSGHGA